MTKLDQVSKTHNANKNASMESDDRPTLKTLTEHERFLIRDTWWKFRKDPNCRLFRDASVSIYGLKGFVDSFKKRLDESIMGRK